MIQHMLSINILRTSFVSKTSSQANPQDLQLKDSQAEGDVKDCRPRPEELLPVSGNSTDLHGPMD